METRRRRNRNAPLPGPDASIAALVPVTAAALLLCWLPSTLAAQAPGAPALEDRGVGLGATGGIGLPTGGLAAVADPGLSAGGSVSVPLGRSLSVRIDGGLELPARDVAAGPLINFYSGVASLEFVAQQNQPGRPPLRTGLSLGAGLTVVEAAEMPVAAPSGATFSERYPTLAAGARLGYPVTSGFVIYLAPRLMWLDMPGDDWSRLTAGLGAPAPDNVWLVPIRAGARVGL